MAIAPDRSLQQRRDALQAANYIRLFRSRLKKDLKTGKASMVDILLDPPEEIATMKIHSLISAAPGIGWSTANMWLKKVHISPSKTVVGMSERQRDELVRMFRQYSERVAKYQEYRERRKAS